MEIDKLHSLLQVLHADSLTLSRVIRVVGGVLGGAATPSRVWVFAAPVPKMMPCLAAWPWSLSSAQESLCPHLPVGTEWRTNQNIEVMITGSGREPESNSSKA